MRSKIALLAGFVLGAGAATIDSRLVHIPAAREAERAAVLAEIEARGAKHIAEASKGAREIEQGVRDESDEDLRRLIGGRPY